MTNDLLYLKIQQSYENYQKKRLAFLNFNEIDTSSLALKEVQKAFEQYLEVDPENIEIRFQYSIFLYEPPIADPYKALEYLNSILEYDPQNVFALLLMVYFNDFSLGGIEETLFQKLCSVNTNDSNILSMVELAKAWYFQWTDINKYEQSLLKSIYHGSKNVNSYVYLAELYIKQNKISQAHELLKIAISNVSTTLTTQDCLESGLQTLNDFLNERYKGIRKTEIIYDSIIEMYNATKFDNN